jgi:hypothetical protein
MMTQSKYTGRGAHSHHYYAMQYKSTIQITHGTAMGKKKANKPDANSPHGIAMGS